MRSWGLPSPPAALASVFAEKLFLLHPYLSPLGDGGTEQQSRRAWLLHLYALAATDYQCRALCYLLTAWLTTPYNSILSH